MDRGVGIEGESEAGQVFVEEEVGEGIITEEAWTFIGGQLEKGWKLKLGGAFYERKWEKEKEKLDGH